MNESGTAYCEEKTHSKYGYIRARDCFYAEYMGYRWYRLTQKRFDFKERPFTHFMSRSDDLSNAFEPDTRVPNFTSRAVPALQLAEMLGVDVDGKYHAMIMADVDEAIAEKMAKQLARMKEYEGEENPERE